MEYQDTFWADQAKTQTGMADVVAKYMQNLHGIARFDEEGKFKLDISK
jgi:hypothetical protein